MLKARGAKADRVSTHRTVCGAERQLATCSSRKRCAVQTQGSCAIVTSVIRDQVQSGRDQQTQRSRSLFSENRLTPPRNHFHGAPRRCCPASLRAQQRRAHARPSLLPVFLAGFQHKFSWFCDRALVQRDMRRATLKLSQLASYS